MGSPDYSEFSLAKYPLRDISRVRVAIIHTEWNTEIIERLLNSCQNCLTNYGVQPENIQLHTVPGSFELPAGAKYLLASRNKPDAIICLGCVIKGETKHDDYINNAIASALAHLNIASSVPVIFGVLTTNDQEQAIARSGGSRGDKGAESAIAALKMISLKENLEGDKSKISF